MENIEEQLETILCWKVFVYITAKLVKSFKYRRDTLVGVSVAVGNKPLVI